MRKDHDMFTTTGQSKVVFSPHGVIRLIAEQYPSLHEAFMEGVQNALDSNPSFVRLSINISGQGQALIQDDGTGLSRADFDNRLSRVANSIKAGDDSTIGEKGIGWFAFYGKADEYEITSAPAQVRDRHWEGYTTHHMCQLKVNNHGEIVIPWEEESLTAKNRKWRTRVSDKKFKDKRLFSRFDIEALIRDIKTRYSSKMVEVGCSVFVTFVDRDNKTQLQDFVVDPQVFAGRHVEDFALCSAEEDCGAVVIKLHVSDKELPAERRLQLRCGSSRHFRIPLAEALSGGGAKELRGYLKGEGAFSILTSPHFSGEVIAPNCTWLASRTGIVVDGAAESLILFLEDWADRAGRDLLQQLKADKTDDDYRQAVVTGQRWFLELIDTGELRESFAKGPLTWLPATTVSEGHVGSEKLPKDTKGRSSNAEKTPTKGTRGGKKTTGQGETPETPTKSRPRHKEGYIHTSMVTEDGYTRYKDQNQPGVQVELRKLPGEKRLFYVNEETASLVINQLHPHCVACHDKGGKMALPMLMLEVMVAAMEIYSYTDVEMRRQAEQVVHTFRIPLAVERIVSHHRLIRLQGE